MSTNAVHGHCLCATFLHMLNNRVHVTFIIPGQFLYNIVFTADILKCTTFLVEDIAMILNILWDRYIYSNVSTHEFGGCITLYRCLR